MKKLNLDALEAKRIVTFAGQDYHVRAITPRVAAIIDGASQIASDVEKMVAYYDAVALLIPTMARHDVDNLDASQVAAIFEFAKEQVAAVTEAAADPNVPRPSRATRRARKT